MANILFVIFIIAVTLFASVSADRKRTVLNLQYFSSTNGTCSGRKQHASTLSGHTCWGDCFRRMLEENINEQSIPYDLAKSRYHAVEEQARKDIQKITNIGSREKKKLASPTSDSYSLTIAVLKPMGDAPEYAIGVTTDYTDNMCKNPILGEPEPAFGTALAPTCMNYGEGAFDFEATISTSEIFDWSLSDIYLAESLFNGCDSKHFCNNRPFGSEGNKKNAGLHVLTPMDGYCLTSLNGDWKLRINERNKIQEYQYPSNDGTCSGPVFSFMWNVDGKRARPNGNCYGDGNGNELFGNYGYRRFDVQYTLAPTAVPTLAPTVAPTEAPTVAPTEAPTDAPYVRRSLLRG